MNEEEKEDFAIFIHKLLFEVGDAGQYGTPALMSEKQVEEKDKEALKRFIDEASADTSPLRIRYEVFRCVGFDEVGHAELSSGWPTVRNGGRGRRQESRRSRMGRVKVDLRSLSTML